MLRGIPTAALVVAPSARLCLRDQSRRNKTNIHAPSLVGACHGDGSKTGRRRDGDVLLPCHGVWLVMTCAWVAARQASDTGDSLRTRCLLRDLRRSDLRRSPQHRLPAKDTTSESPCAPLQRACGALAGPALTAVPCRLGSNGSRRNGSRH